MRLDTVAVAIVVWMPAGETPRGADFIKGRVEGPPHPNLKACWDWGMALVSAMITRAPGKAPWIKSGTTLLNCEQIKAAYAQVRESSELIEPYHCIRPRRTSGGSA